MTQVTVRVPAKLNMSLSVGPRRSDGYHDLVTVYHAVSLFDQVTVTESDTDQVTVTGEGAAQVPAGPDNLALRAVAMLRAALPGVESRVRVTIAKRIPVAAGLAGGSADAAAALVACNQLWRAGLTQQQLCDVAADIGSDVPFSVLGGTAVGRGRGEELTSVLVKPVRYHWVLAFSSQGLSTPSVYAKLDELRPRAAAPELDASLLTALRSGDPVRVGRALSNDLQRAAIALRPGLRKVLTAGEDLGALGALVSGSGPSCVFLARNADRALALAAGLTGTGVCRAVATAVGPVPGAAVLDR